MFGAVMTFLRKHDVPYSLAKTMSGSGIACAGIGAGTASVRAQPPRATRVLCRHDGADDEFDAQQERHEHGEIAHRVRRDKARREAPDHGENQHARHHNQAVFDIEISVFVVGVR